MLMILITVKDFECRDLDILGVLWGVTVLHNFGNFEFHLLDRQIFCNLILYIPFSSLPYILDFFFFFFVI